jgi:ribosomal protein L13E
MSQEDESKKGAPLVKPPLDMPREGIMREGRGFSYSEIDKAGATVDDLRMAHLRVDPLRKSSHEENVKTLQELLGTKRRERAAGRSKQKTETKPRRKGDKKRVSSKK